MPEVTNTRRTTAGRVLTAICIVIGGGLAFAYGSYAERHQLFPFGTSAWLRENARSAEQGRFLKARGGQSAKDAIVGLAYLSGHKPREARQPSSTRGQSSDPSAYYLVVSGHGPEALLIDHEGNELFKWRRPYADVWPGPLDTFSDTPARTYWRRAHVFPNGDLLALFGGIGLVKVDQDSRVLWSYKRNPHHDFDFDDAGNIYTITRDLRKNTLLTVREHKAKEIIADDVVVLDPNGKELRRVSILECFQNSDYASMLELANIEIDVLHTNAIRYLDGKAIERLPFVKKGDVLLSFRHLHAIAVLDLDAQKVKWALAGQWSFQHDPRILADGNMLVFDNGGARKRSTVIEIDPLTRQEKWSFRGGVHADFYTKTCGASRRLPNGNTLIVESDNGRAFEVTPDHRIVWTYSTPYRSGKDRELVATLFDVERIDRSRLRFDPRSRQFDSGKHP